MNNSCTCIYLTLGCRRPAYITTIALGLPIVHSTWVIKSIQKRHILPLESYFLPSGSSPFLPHFIFAKPLPTHGVFKNIRLANLAGGIWDRILTLSGGTLISEDKEFLLKSIGQRALPFKGKLLIQPDYVIIDPLYINGGVDEQIISKCLESHNIVVVTTDWIVYCIQTGELIDPYSSILFTYHADLQKPLWYKSAATGRFEIKDVVYYKSSLHSEDRCIGRILEFSRRTITSAMQVRIQPLLLEETSTERVITLCNGMECLISADCLDSRPVVIDWETYHKVDYAIGDITVLASSPEWERLELSLLATDDSQDEYGNAKNICFSQDY
jgi:hypothetical protein